MNIDNFKKWDLLPLSFSKISQFKQYPSQFVLQRIYKMQPQPSVAMKIGLSVEQGLHHYLSGLSFDKARDIMLEHFYENVGIPYEDTDIEKMKSMFNQTTHLLRKNYEYLSYQEEVQTTILDIPVVGYVDFIFTTGDTLEVIDLKCKNQMRFYHTENLQQTIYRKALQEKYNKPVNVSLYVVTPKKHEFKEIEYHEDYMVELENTVKGLDKVLEICNEPKDFAYLYQPNIDDFIWNNETLLSQRKEVWGI